MVEAGEVLVARFCRVIAAVAGEVPALSSVLVILFSKVNTVCGLLGAIVKLSPAGRGAGQLKSMPSSVSDVPDVAGPVPSVVVVPLDESRRGVRQPTAPAAGKVRVIGWLPCWKAAAALGLLSPSESRTPVPALVDVAVMLYVPSPCSPLVKAAPVAMVEAERSEEIYAWLCPPSPI